MPDRPGAGIVVPLRSFVRAKERLASVLDERARTELARAMADRVVAAASPHPVVVVSSAPEVEVWARAQSFDVVADPGTLDAAADAGRAWARAHAMTRVVVAHGDLPFAESFEALVAPGAALVAVIVRDHRRDGTPAISLPTAVPFTFSYGEGSAARHEAEARRCGLEVRVLDDDVLGFDVDTPDDLGALRTGGWAPAITKRAQ